jgi:hypothetical protein
MESMKLVVALFLVMTLVNLAPAQSGGLDGAIERQRQSIETQRGETRREMERQGRSLQQQQDQNLQFQLQLRQQPVAPPLRPGCAQVGGKLFCQ